MRVENDLFFLSKRNCCCLLFWETQHSQTEQTGCKVPGFVCCFCSVQSSAPSFCLGSICPFPNSSQGTALKWSDRHNARQTSIAICYQEGLKHTAHPKQMHVECLAHRAVNVNLSAEIIRCLAGGSLSDWSTTAGFPGRDWKEKKKLKEMVP